MDSREEQEVRGFRQISLSWTAKKPNAWRLDNKARVKREMVDMEKVEETIISWTRGAKVR